MSIQYRSEHDSVGERSVPKDVYYGVQSLRAAENFPITGLAVHPEQINSIAEIKKASAITNLEIGLLDKRVADAIVRACDEIAAGRLHEAFIVDPIQGGAGTSLNMNANEVIANRAIELLGGEKLPKMDVLKEKRRQLAARKKALYLEYRKAQQDMRELVAVKGSVDHLRGLTDNQRNKEQAR